jgi:8-oxo-dGTP pyrophosphatase MutT (NUDIX family)
VEAAEYPMPPGLLRHVRDFYAAGTAPATPKLASTVLLLRDGPEVYLIRRAATMAFAAGMHAFPGGGVDPRDATVHPSWAGPTPADWAHRLGQDEPTARAIVSAAVREVFEECGVLLAGPDAETVVGDVSGDEWEAARVALIDRKVGFAEFLAGRGLVLRSDLLTPWARWLTPEFEPRRYDTYFFLARLPQAQLTRHVGGEADRVLWGRPEDLATLPMLPPTLAALRGLRGYPDVDAAMAAHRDVTTAVMPRADLTGPQARLVLDPYPNRPVM